MLVCMLVVGLPLIAKDKKKGDKEEEEAKWDVSNPGGDWQTITIDTDETTWSAVDVSPEQCLSYAKSVARDWKEDGARNVRLMRVTCPDAVKRAYCEAEEVAERLGS